MKNFALLVLSLLCLFAGCSNAPVQQTKLIEFDSPNGYTLSYPEEYLPSSLSHDIDFVVMDTKTGTTVTVQTAEEEDALNITEQEFIDARKAENMEISVLSFEKKEINGSDALSVEYRYKENLITLVTYQADGKVYRATYTQLPGTSEKMRSEMLAIINSLTIR